MSNNDLFLFILKSGRARIDSDDFIVPRWIPDEEVSEVHYHFDVIIIILYKKCYKCHSEFDWINRRHHWYLYFINRYLYLLFLLF